MLRSSHLKTWLKFNSDGDLPPGLHAGRLEEVLQHFANSPRRLIIARRLERIWNLARSTGHLSRFIIFGSFVTKKTEPNDIDIFLLMEDTFDVQQTSSEARVVFDHAAAQNL